MEYEQLEKLNKAVLRSIEIQDSCLLYDLLSPDVLLVTHFPYPDLASSDAGVMAICETTSLERSSQPVSDRRRKQQLLEESAAYWKRQSARYAAAQTSQERGSVVAGGVMSAAPPGQETARGLNGTVKPSNKAEAARSRSKSQKRTSTVDTAKASAYSREPPGVSFYFDVISKPSEPDHVAATGATKGRRKGPPAGTAAAGAGGAAVEATPAHAAGGAAGATADTELGASSTGDASESPAVLEKVGSSLYAKHVDVAEGRSLVTERLCLLLHWLGRGKYIAEAHTQLEPLKGILQDSEMARPPPSPTNPAEFFARLGRQYTERNQRLSRLTVHWGRENLLFVDQYFLFDGVVVTIQRAMVPLQEMLRTAPVSQQHLSATQRTEKVRQEVMDFYGANRTRVNAVHAAWPMLDFSFCEVTDPTDLVRMTPVTGKKHIARPVRPEIDPHLAHGVYLNETNDPSQRAQAPSKQLIKAKNKRGDEEAYEFEMNARNRFGFLNQYQHEKNNNPLDAFLADPSRITYDAASVRIASCKLAGSLDSLVPTLRGLVANTLLTLHALDLSDNAITTLPEDLRLLPLQRLQLHANAISDWHQVDSVIAALPFLHSLTLHGNPLAQQNGEKYWPTLIAKLLRHPNRRVKLRQVDFVTLTAQDYNVAGAHEMFTTGDMGVLNTARLTFRA